MIAGKLTCICLPESAAAFGRTQGIEFGWRFWGPRPVPQAQEYDIVLPDDHRPSLMDKSYLAELTDDLRRALPHLPPDLNAAYRKHLAVLEAQYDERQRSAMKNMKQRYAIDSIVQCVLMSALLRSSKHLCDAIGLCESKTKLYRVTVPCSNSKGSLQRKPWSCH